jgi:CheY-like chemotaxis protein
MIMATTPRWRVLFVDDDQDVCRQVKEFLEGESVAGPGEYPDVQTCTDFDEALQVLESHRFDVVILDVRLGPYDLAQEGEEAGTRALSAIRQRRFVPVVFYTGLPHLVQHLQTPLVQVVEKTAGLQQLLQVVRDLFATRLPAVNRALLRHLDSVQRDYMWDFVVTHWDRFVETSDRTTLAYLLARRLAMSLSGPGIRQLAEDLGDPTASAATEGCVHPMQYCVIPPVTSTPLSGDLYRGKIGDIEGYWVLLTPSCDFIERDKKIKAEWALLARCSLLADQPEYGKWQMGLPEPSRTASDSLCELMRNSRQGGQPERFYFLPGALTLPGMIVDFQQLVTVPRAQLDGLKRLASLDSPFAEAFLARFARYFGRLGTPDLDVDLTLSRLKSTPV